MLLSIVTLLLGIGAVIGGFWLVEESKRITREEGPWRGESYGCWMFGWCLFIPGGLITGIVGFINLMH